MLIRLARPDDAPAIAELMVQLTDDSVDAPDPGVEERFHALLAPADQAVFVAENAAGVVIGMLSVCRRLTLWHSGPCALIDELVVDRTARGHGTGRALVGAAWQWAYAAGCSEISVTTAKANEVAQAFYRRIGLNEQAVLLEHHFAAAEEQHESS